MRPGRPPLVRAAGWTTGSLLYVAVVVWWMAPAELLMSRLADGSFVLQQFSALATAAAAAAAALWATIPGRRRSVIMLPIALTAMMWMGTVAAGTIQDWIAAGSAGLTLRSDWRCVAGIVIVGTAPASAMGVMLRRGTPLAPRTATALAALAAASLASVGMCIAEPHERHVIVLVWHGMTMAALAAAGAVWGRSVLKWDHVASLTPRRHRSLAE